MAPKSTFFKDKINTVNSGSDAVNSLKPSDAYIDQ